MTRKKKRRGRGRPAWKPSRKEREQIRTACAMGWTDVEVARMFGVTAKTLRKHCREEIDTAAQKAVTSVALSLYKQATGADGRPPNVVAAIFFLKAKGGWRDNDARSLGDAAEGKKAARNAAAAKVASSGRFAPGQAPRLATVNGKPAAAAPPTSEPPKP